MSKDFFDTAELVLNAPGDTAWGNFGYWNEAETFPEACEELARIVADAIELGPDDHLLDLGFGMGEQLRLWHTAYGLNRLTGLNPARSQVDFAQSRLPADGFVLHSRGAEELVDVNIDPPVNKALALDCAYHFPQRAQVFAEVAQRLPVGGLFAWTDLYLPPRAPSLARRAKLAAICTSAKIPRENLIELDAYSRMLQSAGLELVEQEDLSDAVLAPFALWWRCSDVQHRLSRRHRLKYDLTAQVVESAAMDDLFRYGLFVARRV